MKIRTSFVSNSSSSSFIVAFKDMNKKCECCGRQDPNIINLIEDMSYYSYECDYDVERSKKDILYRFEMNIKEDEDFLRSLENRYVKADCPISTSQELQIIEAKKQLAEDVEHLQFLKEQFDKYEEDGYEIYRLRIADSNYYEIAQIFENCKKNGSIIQIESGD